MFVFPVVILNVLKKGGFKVDRNSKTIYIGVGGRGNDLLNQLIAADEVKRGLFAVDTDAQTLMKSMSPKRIQPRFLKHITRFLNLLKLFWFCQQRFHSKLPI